MGNVSLTPILHLASSSPRRREILQALGLTFTVAAVAVDETPLDTETPEDMVLRLAVAKAAAAKVAVDDLVLGSDTCVVLDGQALGKPRDRDHAVEMLLSLAGRTHLVVSGVALRSSAGTRTALSSTEVRFRKIDHDEALLYWQSEEPRDKAGGYGIQGLGGVFVESISGSYSGVMGMPVFETAELLRDAGVEVVVNRK